MRKWLKLLIISGICCIFTGVPIFEDLAALIILSLGTSWFISEIRKPIKH